MSSPAFLRPRSNRDMARLMSEDELLQAITEAATYLGWRWHHVRRSDKALQQGHSGFPDLVLAKEGRLLFLELKSAHGQLREDQREWLEQLVGCETVSARVVTPYELDSVLVDLGARLVG